MSASHQDIRIGTSGWSYPHWRKTFYPDGLPESDMLKYYAGQFHSVEINSTFYQLPDRDVLQSWYESVPDDFVFCAKASRYITHMKKLMDPSRSLSTFLDRISLLEDKLGPILFQMPPYWHVNAQRLAAFLAKLSDNFRYSFEFRDRSWLNEQVIDLLEHNNVAFCIYDLEGYQTPRNITADFIYIRLHGPDRSYQGNYDRQALSGWAGAITTWSSQGHEVYCHFNNDQDAHSAHNAHALDAMLRK